MTSDKEFAQLTQSDVGKKYTRTCRIESIHETSGPTIFVLHDGTAVLRSVKFTKDRKRAYPDLNEGDTIAAELRVTTRDGAIEAILESYNELTQAQQSEFVKVMKKMESTLHEIDVDSFLIESEILEKLKPRMIELTKAIKKAVMSGTPIILRHHADCDGYVSGIALERAILPLVRKKHGSDRFLRQYFRRVPSKTPFYDFMDASKDVFTFLEDKKRYKTRAPLIILVDHGSAQENLRSLNMVTIFGATVAIVDHHDPGEIKEGTCAVDEFVDYHVSTHLVGHRATLCAGQLCVELARFINIETSQFYYLAAMAGVADRVSGVEMDAYLAIAEKEGYDEDMLRKYARCIDYEANFLGFSEAREFVEAIMGEDTEQRRALADMISDRIEAKVERHKKTAAQYYEEQQCGSVHVAKINVEKTTFRGDFISGSKISRLVFDLMEEKYDGHIIVLGYSSDRVTIRASRDIDGFDLNRMREAIDREIPHAVISGGGHAVAGTLKFVAASHDEVMAFMMDYLSNY